MKQKRPKVPEKYQEMVRFCIVGGIASAIHYGVYLLFALWLEASLAYIIGYLVSLVGNFFLSSLFTFRTKPTVKKSLGFAFSHLVNLCLHYVFFRFFQYVGVPDSFVPIPTMCVVVPINFVLVRFFLKKP
jgi:putative flippase GtrA